MSLNPAKYNFTIWKGATFHKRVIYFEDRDATEPTDLTDFTAELIIRDRPDGDPLLTLDTSNGGITLGDATGTIDLNIDAVDTATITWKKGFYDLLVTAPLGGDTDALLYGAFTVKSV